MLNYLKKHAFILVFGVFFALYFAFLMLIFFAPRVDVYERGFVACTKNMIGEFSACHNGKIRCAAKIMLKNHLCDFNVVKTGFSLWLNGEQKTPWANYYFEPVEEDLNPTEDEALQAYYKEHADIVKEMEDLNKKYIELEEQLNGQGYEVPQAPVKNQGEINEQQK